MQNAKFSVGFATTQEELMGAYKLRYEDLVLSYRQDNVTELGYDTNDYDSYAKHIIVKEVATGEIVGYYRMIESGDIPAGKTFVCEEEYQFDALKRSGEKICEFSRAVVKKEYRGGVVLLMLWKFIMKYMLDNGVRYMIGDASFYGTDRDVYLKQISYLVNNYAIDPSLNIRSRDTLPPMQLIPTDGFDDREMLNSLPPLIKAYVTIGASISSETFTDTAFGSVDVFILVDLHHYNEAYVKRLLSF